MMTGNWFISAIASPNPVCLRCKREIKCGLVYSMTIYYWPGFAIQGDGIAQNELFCSSECLSEWATDRKVVTAT